MPNSILRLRDPQSRRLEWTRYWVQREGTYHEDSGFLREPESFELTSSQLLTLEGLDDEPDNHPCVLALGDPGLGKSIAIGRYVEHLRARISEAQPNDYLMENEVSRFESTEAFATAVFRHPSVEEWKASSGRLYIVLDGLDESVIALSRLVSRLLDELDLLPLTRVRLRLGCRTSVLSGDITTGLLGLFQRKWQEAYGSEPRVELTQLELLPLLQRDAKLFVRSEAIKRGTSHESAEAESERFLSLITASAIGPFAARPITLESLTRRFLSGDSLNLQQTELFESLTKQLCQVDMSRARPGFGARPTKLTTGQRMAAAGRIAALLLLGNRKAVDVTATDAPAASSLLISHVPGSEKADGAPFSLDEALAFEALNTALFTEHGVDQFGPAHATFAEFLAARWLRDRELSASQLSAVLTDPQDPSGRIIPQLRALAGWAAAMIPSFFEACIRVDPEVLLNDAINLTTPQRRSLVEALIRASRDNTLAPADFLERRPYDKLGHPGLSTQLRSLIGDETLPERLRILVLEIARLNRVDLADEAVIVALSSSEPLALRVDAANLIEVVGQPVHKRQVIPLFKAPPANDVADELKGAALCACWQELSPVELFADLKDPKRPNYSGSYARAMRMLAGVVSNLNGGMPYLEPGLEWVRNRRTELLYGESNLIDSVLAGTVGALAHDNASSRLLEGIVAYLAELGAQYEQLPGTASYEPRAFLHALEEHDHVRRLILRRLLASAPEDRTLIHWVSQNGDALFAPDDYTDLILHLNSLEPRSPSRLAIRELLRWRLDATNLASIGMLVEHDSDDDVNYVLQASGLNALLSQFGTAELVADHVRTSNAEALEAHERQQLADTETARSNRPAEPSAARVSDVLTRSAGQGNGERWPRLHAALLRPSERSGGSSAYGDPTRGAVWSELGEGERSEAVSIASTFLNTSIPTSDPYPSNRTTYEAVWGYSAARLMLATRRTDLVSDAAWASWALVIAGRRTHGGAEETRDHVEVVRHVSERAPAAMLQAIEELVARELDPPDPQPMSNLSESAITGASGLEGIVEALQSVATAPFCSADLLTTLLGPLLDAGIESAVEVAVAIADPAQRELGEDATRRIAAAGMLLGRSPDAGWGLLWGELSGGGEFAAQVFLHLATRYGRWAANERYSPLSRLSEEQLGGLFQVLTSEFPPEQDPWHVGAYSPSPRDEVAHWRSAVLNGLVERKTQAAVDVLREIAEADPARDWLMYHYFRASTGLRSDRWIGSQPTVVLTLAARPEARLVESGRQLLEVVAESLTRLERCELHGEWREVDLMWERWTGIAGQRPRDEQALSNLIARHLRRDLSQHNVVIGRELVIQTGIPEAGSGDRTDIDLRAVIENGQESPYPNIRAVLEIKGSWHPEVGTSMETQLVDRYLDPIGIRHGMYIVGYYTCEAWHQSDRRKARSASLGSALNLKARLQLQAADLSYGGRDIRSFILDMTIPSSEQRNRSRRPAVMATRAALPSRGRR